MKITYNNYDISDAFAGNQIKVFIGKDYIYPVIELNVGYNSSISQIELNKDARFTLKNDLYSFKNMVISSFGFEDNKLRIVIIPEYITRLFTYKSARVNGNLSDIIKSILNIDLKFDIESLNIDRL